MRVFFVYKQLDGKYTIWGETKVSKIDSSPLKESDSDEKGFAFMHFEKFDPLLKEKWVRNLSAEKLVGNEWRQGRFRFIDAYQENKLEQLINGKSIEDHPDKSVALLPSGMINLNVGVMPYVADKLDEIAYKEGRQRDEIIREAIAEWLKGRQ